MAEIVIGPRESGMCTSKSNSCAGGRGRGPPLAAVSSIRALSRRPFLGSDQGGYRAFFFDSAFCSRVVDTMAEDIEEILSEIDGSQMEEYQRFFDMFDRGKQGYIMATQIGQIMHGMEQDFDEKTLRKLIRKFDADGSGKLEFDEFCALVYTVANTVDKETLEKELREAFRLFDKEGNGYISRPTLKALLKEIADDLTDAQLESAVDEIDEDGSGKIEFEEFWELMAGESD